MLGSYLGSASRPARWYLVLEGDAELVLGLVDAGGLPVQVIVNELVVFGLPLSSAVSCHLCGPLVVGCSSLLQPTHLCLLFRRLTCCFEQAHDKTHHDGIKRKVKNLANVSMMSLTRRVKDYVEHCPVCQENATIRQKIWRYVVTPAQAVVGLAFPLPKEPEGWQPYVAEDTVFHLYLCC